MAILPHAVYTRAASSSEAKIGGNGMAEPNLTTDEVLRRMLNTPHESHKPLRDRPAKKDRPQR